MLTIVDQQVVYVTDVFTRVVQHCAAPHVFGWICCRQPIIADAA